MPLTASYRCLDDVSKFGRDDQVALADALSKQESMARGNVVEDDDDDGSGSEEDQDFDAEAEDSDTSPKKGQKRRKSLFVDDAASEEDDEVLSGNFTF